MKKNIISIVFAAALLCLSYIASAIPAKPGKITLTQPDGTTITVRVHGDEWFHYVTDENGILLEENAAGYLVKSNETIASVEAKMIAARTAKRRALELAQDAVLKAQVTGSPKIPVVLVQFKDKSFSISNPKTAFTNLLSQSGYSDNGGTGSVSDYYYDQSRGAYTPEFVVMDVVTLSSNMSTYGSSDTNAAKALYEACQSLDSSVDFSQFDNDGDGKIDMALMYYAGYNEAEGASSSTIWPHQYYVPYVVTNAQSFDGVTLNRYFCTSELKGTSGTRMCGIGTTCHEFAHSLGLPDFYDTNYDEYGDGEAGATYSYDVMCSGSYNNSSCTPPWMNAEELVMLGWMDSITELSAVGSVSIPSIGSDNPVAYKTSTSTSGEYFLYECRPGTGWDSPLSPGLLVYHVDKSTAHRITWKTSSSASSTQTAYNLWANWSSYNAINCNGDHPCFYVVPAGSQSSLNYSGSNFTFPGTSSITNYTPVDWSGSDTGFTASGIAFNSTTKTVTFNLSNSNECGVNGIVMDSDGNPIEGVTVSISTSSASGVSSGTGSKLDIVRKGSVLKASGTVLQTVTTNATGSYSFTVENAGTYIVEVSKSGYVSGTASVEVSRMVTQNFYLLREGEEAPSELYTYPDDAEWGDYGSSSYSSWDIMCANYYPASILSAYAGKQVKSISFQFAGETDADGNTTTTGKAYALLDFGTERKVALEVENPVANDWNTVDVTDLEIRLEAGTDVFAGYALEGWAYSYPITAAEPASSTLVGYLDDFDLTSTAWEAWSYVFKVKINIGDYVPAETGFNYISDPGNGTYGRGDNFVLNLVETSSDRRPNSEGIAWFYDDEPASGSVTLNSAGSHTITAKFTTVSGERKVIDLEITVE